MVTLNISYWWDTKKEYTYRMTIEQLEIKTY
jgi:hypothetical protein